MERKSLPFMESQEPTVISHLKTAWTYPCISEAVSFATAKSINMLATNHINNSCRKGQLSSGSLQTPQVPLVSSSGGHGPTPSEDNTPVVTQGGEISCLSDADSWGAATGPCEDSHCPLCAGSSCLMRHLVEEE